MSIPPSAVFGAIPQTNQSHVCVFGQGDCGSYINNTSITLNNNLTENLTSNTTIKNTAASAILSSTQNMDFSGMDLSGCSSINFSNISNVSMITYNFNMMSKNITSTQYNAILKQSVDTALKSDAKASSEAFSGGAQGTVNNVTANYNNTVNRLVNSCTYTDFTKIMATMSSAQTISFKGMKVTGMLGPACNWSGITNNSSIRLAMSLVSDTVTSEFTKLMQENAAKTASSATTTTVATGVIGDTGRAVSGVVTAAGNAVSTAASGVITGALTGLMLPLLFLFMVIIFIAIGFAAVRKASGESPPAAVPVTQESPAPPSETPH